jgi:hypothetical protein
VNCQTILQRDDMGFVALRLTGGAPETPTVLKGPRTFFLFWDLFPELILSPLV